MSETMSNQEVCQLLVQAQDEFNHILSTLSDEQLEKTPKTGGWNVLQVTQHLRLAENAFRERIRRMLSEEGEQRSEAEFAEQPRLMAVADTVPRTTKREAPEFSLPGDNLEKGEVLQGQKEARSHTIQLLETLLDLDLNRYKDIHYRFGTLTASEWFQLIAYHQKRHILQVQEIIEEW